jgi:hypothetical protein
MMKFGGSKARSYQLLGDVIHAQNTFLGIFNPNTFQKGPISQDLSRTVEEQARLSNKGILLIDLDDINYLTTKIYRLGQRKAVQLLEFFGSINDVRRAKTEELQEVPGIGEKLAHRIKTEL